MSPVLKQPIVLLYTKVAELTMQTEYQLRLKDLHLQERVKEVTEKFTAELEADRQKSELLLQEKNEQEMEFEDKLKQVRDFVFPLSICSFLISISSLLSVGRGALSGPAVHPGYTVSDQDHG